MHTGLYKVILYYMMNGILLCVLVMFICIGIDKLIECIGKMYKIDKVYETVSNSALNSAINDSK